MNENIKHLYIVGNGFDLAHKYPTSYNNFREYLMNRYPGADEYFESIPESTMMPDGELVYDEDEIAGYILRILDNCSGGDWSDFESYLGDGAIVALKDELEWLDLDDDSEKHWNHAVYNNEDLSNHIKNTFPCVRDYFCDWIMDYYSKFTYGLNSLGIGGGPNNSIDYKDNIGNVLAGGDGFLTFNYTLTLERVYNIPSENICHVHGKVGLCKEDIFVGHGEEGGVDESFDIIGAEGNLSELKSLLYKDTADAWNRHSDFFDRLGKELVDIHSFGFSFSDVDLQGYVKRIAEKVDVSKVVWYINGFDDSEIQNDTISGRKLSKQIEKLKDIGFRVEVDSRW